MGGYCFWIFGVSGFRLIKISIIDISCFESSFRIVEPPFTFKKVSCDKTCLSKKSYGMSDPI